MLYLLSFHWHCLPLQGSGSRQNLLVRMELNESENRGSPLLAYTANVTDLG